MRPDESNTMLSGNAPVVKNGVTNPDTVSMRTRVPGLVNNVPKTVAAPVCALASSENMTTNTPRRTLFRWDMVRLLFLYCGVSPSRAWQGQPPMAFRGDYRPSHGERQSTKARSYVA